MIKDADQTMRILHVVESLELGGAERVITDLIVNMPSEIESFVCCLKKTGAMEGRLPNNTVVFELDSPEGNNPKIIVLLARILKKQRIDVVHGHNWNTFIECGGAALLAGSIPVVHTIHGMYIKQMNGITGRIKQILRKSIERWLAGKCCRVCPVSDAIKQYTLPHLALPVEKVQTIINGVSVGDTTRSKLCRSDLGIRDSAFVLCFVGRVAEEKNLFFLFSLMPQLVKEIPDVQLLIVGDGTERNTLEEYSREKGFADHVLFVGFQSEPLDYLACADVFVLPSRYEGISIAILEAMSAGLPVVATDVGGNREVVVPDETGIIVPLDDKRELLEGLLLLSRNLRLREQMSTNAFKRVRNHFNIRGAAEKYVKIYRECKRGQGCG